MEAVKAARASLPDLILMDVYLGEISGMAAAYQIQRDSATSSIPIVCITAFDLNPALAQAVGCKAMLQKPVPADRLVSVLRGLLPDTKVQPEH